MEQHKAVGVHFPHLVRNSTSTSRIRSTSASMTSPPTRSTYLGLSLSPIKKPKLYTALSFGLPIGKGSPFRGLASPRMLAGAACSG